MIPQEMLTFILLNSAVFFSSYLLTLIFLKFENILDSILAVSLLFFSQIILIIILLGSFNLLYLKNIILLVFAILLLCILLFKRKQSITHISIFFKPVHNSNNEILGKIELFCLSFIIGFAIVKIIINLINPPFGWDSLNYHFTFPIEWLKHGNLVNSIVVSDYPAPTYYPMNGSFIYFWLILPFKSVFIADIGQLPFFIIGFLAVLSISKKIGINTTNSFLAASLFTITPNYFKQLSIAYVDVMVSALFLTFINYTINFYDNFDIKSLILLSISAGLLIGTKIIALPYAAAISLFIILFILINRKKIKRGLVLIFIFMFFVLLLGAFSYIRNWFLTNNLFYPVDLKILGIRVFKGVMTASFPWAELDFSGSKLLFHEGMGAGTILFVIPGLILTFIHIIKERLFKIKICFLVLLIPTLYLIYRYVIHLSNTRYLYPLLGISYIVAFFGITNFKIPAKIINFLVVVCFLTSIAEISRHLELGIALSLSLLLFLISLMLYKQIFFYFTKPITIVISIILILFGLSILHKDYIANEYDRYWTSRKYSGFWPDAIKAWIWLNQNTKGDNIAYVGRPVPFPLYGTYFKNNVYYVSVNKIEPAELYNFANSKYIWSHDVESMHKTFEEDVNYRGNADYDTWLNNLLRCNIDYFFVYSLHHAKIIQFPLEDIWANNHPEVFNLVFKNDIIHIYKLIK